MVLSPNPQQRLFAFMPLVVFWYLDAYYLHLEKCYRKLYEWTIKNRLICKDYLFDLNAYDRFRKSVDPIPRLMFSRTLIWFYGVVFALTIALNWGNIVEIFYRYVLRTI